MALFLPQRWRRQPSFGDLVINQDHWAAPTGANEGLWVPGLAKFNLFKKERLVLNTTQAQDVGTIYGISSKFNGTSDAYNSGITNVVSTNGVTLFAICRSPNTGSVHATDIDGPAYCGSYGLVWRHIDASYNSVFFIAGDNTYPAARFSPNPLAADTWYTLCGVASSAGIDAYTNGRLTTHNATGWGTNTGSGNLMFGSHPTRTGGGTYWTGYVPFVLKLDRALSASEIGSLSENPWQVFAPQRRVLYFGGTAGAITGDLSKTLDAATLSSASAVLIQGAATPTLADATLVGAATVALVGTATPTLADATISAVGTLSLVGAATPTLDAATLAAVGVLPIVGTATPTLADATVSAAGVLPLIGALSKSLDDATLSATGVLGAVTTGQLDKTLDAATLSATGTLPIVGQAVPTLASVTLSAIGSAPIIGVVAPTLEAATLSASGAILLRATATPALDDATLAATGLLTAAGSRLAILTVTLSDVAASAIVELTQDGPVGGSYRPPRPPSAARIARTERARPKLR